MVLDYTVKYNGKRYLAGENVPDEAFGNVKQKPILTENKPETNSLEQAKVVFEKKADETVKKSKGGRKPKQ